MKVIPEGAKVITLITGIRLFTTDGWQTGFKVRPGRNKAVPLTQEELAMAWFYAANGAAE